MRAPKKIYSCSQSGSALVYILIAIALLAALTFTFMQPASQQTTSQNTFRSATDIDSQINTIRSAIQECTLSYPKGDSELKAVETNARDNYPINPDSTYYTGATPPRSGDQLVRNIRCPGNNPGGLNVKNHEPLFGGSTGKFMPPAPDLFDDWQYYNGIDGVFFWTETTKTDAFVLSALEKLDEKFSECEADIVDARSALKNLDSGGVYKCPSGSLCFRIRMITNASAVYLGDTDGDETVDNAPDQVDCSAAD